MNKGERVKVKNSQSEFCDETGTIVFVHPEWVHITFDEYNQHIEYAFRPYEVEVIEKHENH